MKNYFPSVIIVFLFILVGALSVFPQAKESQAQEAITRQNFRQARQIYTQLAQENPENIAFVLWTARLSAWLGDYKSALQIYDEVLIRIPGNNEALLGKAYVLMWQRKYGKAKEILDLAEKNGRYETAFLIGKINYFRYQNKFSEAREIVRIAHESNAANSEVKELEKMLEKARPQTYQVGCEQNFEPFTATTTGCFVSFNVHEGADNLTLKAQTGKRFGKIYREFGINWQREINEKLSFTISGSIEPRRNINLDSSFGTNYKISRRLQVGIDYRFWRLNQQNINIFSANAAYSINPQTQLQTTLYKSANNVILTRLNRQVSKNLGVGFSFLRSFTTKKVSGFAFSQNALVANGKFQVNKNFSLSGSFGLTGKDGEKPQRIYGFGFTLTK